MSAHKSKPSPSCSTQVGRRLAIEALEIRQLLAIDFHLLADINPTLNVEGAEPNRFVEAGGLVYFTASTPTRGTELWRSDGTPAGTFLVKDILPGSQPSQSIFGPRNLTNVNGTLYFAANDGASGYELWKSDGTVAGTVHVKDINPVGDSYPRGFVSFGGAVYFQTNDGANGRELWKTDGTAEGTSLVFDINPGAASSNVSDLTVFNGKLYFSANDGAVGDEVWTSDGTEAGTSRLIDLRPGIASSYPFDFTAAGGYLFFAANDGATGIELWKTDGTALGTQRLTDANPAGNFTEVNGQLFFTASDGTFGNELWKSNGTAAGTVLVRNIRAGAGDSLPRYLVNINGTLYFRANDGTNGDELWKSDGSAVGTVMVKDIRLGSGSSSNDTDMRLVNAAGTVFFVANDGVHGETLWKSDGSEAGTLMVKDVDIDSGFSPLLGAIGGTVLFSGDDGAVGRELWKSDGTEGGTIVVKDIRAGTRGATPKLPTVFGNQVYFSAQAGPTNNFFELWRTDGTSAGTTPNTDFGGHINADNLLTVVGDTLFYAGGGLWKTDGTPGGTGQVKAVYIQDPTINAEPRLRGGVMVNFNGTLYFTANDLAKGYELWKSDGTSAGTTLFKDINPGPAWSNPNQLTVVGSTMYFVVNDGAAGYELWKTDGTSIGTDIVKNIRAGNSSSKPSHLANVNGTLFFTANDGANGYELWKSDGSVGGTVMVKNVRSGALGSAPANLVNVDGTLYFTANDGVTGVELWKSDGAVTALVKDVHPGAASSDPGLLTSINGTLYFAAYEPVHGRELWSSDGTTAGTALVDDITGDSGDSNPGAIVDLNGTLLVVATTEAYGEEMWYADTDPFPLQGDADADNDVDGDDFLAWQRQFGPSSPGVGADFDEDGEVDAADLAIWQDDFGNSAPMTQAVRSALFAAVAAPLEGDAGGPAFDATSTHSTHFTTDPTFNIAPSRSLIERDATSATRANHRLRRAELDETRLLQRTHVGAVQRIAVESNPPGCASSSPASRSSHGSALEDLDEQYSVAADEVFATLNGPRRTS